MDIPLSVIQTHIIPRLSCKDLAQCKLVFRGLDIDEHLNARIGLIHENMLNQLIEEVVQLCVMVGHHPSTFQLRFYMGRYDVHMNKSCFSVKYKNEVKYRIKGEIPTEAIKLIMQDLIRPRWACPSSKTFAKAVEELKKAVNRSRYYNHPKIKIFFDDQCAVYSYNIDFTGIPTTIKHEGPLVEPYHSTMMAVMRRFKYLTENAVFDFEVI